MNIAVNLIPFRFALTGNKYVDFCSRTFRRANGGGGIILLGMQMSSLGITVMWLITELFVSVATKMVGEIHLSQF